MELINQALVKQTRDLLNAVRGSSVKIGENLYQIKQTLPREQNWGDFIRDEFDISEGFASKLITIYRSFILEGGLSHAKLEGVDTEKLYLVAKLEGTPEEKVEKARLLTRREIKEERTEEDGHEHEPETITLCKVCRMRL